MSEPAVRGVGTPIRSLQIMLAVLARTDEELLKVLPDGIYGAQTARAVRAVQRRLGLAENGQTDHETWNQIVDAFMRRSPLVLPAAPLQIVWQPMQVIRHGEENLQLYLIQGMLAAIGRVYPEMPELRVTGIHDAASIRAVRWFQEKAGLTPDGNLTQLDWLYLTGLYRLCVGDGTEKPF